MEVGEMVDYYAKRDLTRALKGIMLKKRDLLSIGKKIFDFKKDLKDLMENKTVQELQQGLQKNFYPQRNYMDL